AAGALASTGETRLKHRRCPLAPRRVRRGADSLNPFPGGLLPPPRDAIPPVGRDYFLSGLRPERRGRCPRPVALRQARAVQARKSARTRQEIRFARCTRAACRRQILPTVNT